MREWLQINKTITFNEKMNRISPGDATQQRFSAVNQEEDTEATAQKGVIASTKQQYGDDSPEYQAAQDKLTQIQQKATTQRLAIVQQDQSREQQLYQNAFNVIDGGLNRTMDAWLQGTEKMSQAWTKFGDSIAISVINGLARAAAAELVSLATSESVNADKRLDDAKTAAANSFVWASSWGGPIAGAVAAAAAFAGVAAFEEGTGYVPRTGLAMLHEGEAVVPAPTMQDLRGSQPGGNQYHLHYTANGGDQKFHRQNANKSLNDMKRMMRSHNLTT